MRVIYIDREFELLESLSKREMATQRELSKSLNISLGSVNMLLNKMQREGLIKFKNLSARSVAYMLTPKGMAEKTEKTYRYITYHYKRINDTKEKIKDYLAKKLEEEEKIYLVADGSEVTQIVLMAADEMGIRDKLETVETADSVDKQGLLLFVNFEEEMKFEGFRSEMILENI